MKGRLVLHEAESVRTRGKSLASQIVDRPRPEADFDARPLSLQKAVITAASTEPTVQPFGPPLAIT